MSTIIDGVALWLADFHLVATALLLGVLAALAVVKQPARRMAMVKATLGALAGLVLLCALPGWSAVHLLTDRPAPLSEAIVDRLEEVPAEPSATQLIPHVNVDRDPPPRFEHQAILQPELAPSSSQRTEETNWVRVGVFAHAAGSAIVVVWLIAGAVMAGRIRRGAVAASAELQLALERIAGSSIAPRLLASVEVATPVAMGVLDPAIILPTTLNLNLPAPSPWRGGLGRGEAAGTNSITCTHFLAPPLVASQGTTALRTGDFGSPVLGCSHPPQGEGNGGETLPILAHELAHIQNGDLHTLALSRLLLVLLWPQPLFWWLRRSLRLDQEALADAAAAEVAGRVEYAERLVGWARNQVRRHKAPRLAGAVGLWEGPSQLKRRVALLLNEKFLVMRTCSRRWRGACFTAMTLAAVALSLVTLQPATQAANDKGKPHVEATEVERDVAPNASSNAAATISGKIVLEDGTPAKVKGWLYSEATSESSSTISTEGHFADGFSVKVRPGTVWLKHWAEGYAPAWVGPLDMSPGQKLNGVMLVLKPGTTATVQVANAAGEPIAAATLQPLLRTNSSGSGPSIRQVADGEGRLVLRHLADAKYEFRVTAPGYEPLRQDVTISSPPAGVTRSEGPPIVLTMNRSHPTTGVVLNADGSAAKEALIRFRVDASEGHGMNGVQPFGEVAATADGDGQFVLDQLSPGHDYLFLVETADKSRDMMQPIVAGMKNVEVKMAPRRDLAGRVIGDLSKLPERNGKRFIGIRQRVEFKGVNGHQYGDLIGEDVYVTPTDEGGEFTYEGLVDAPVEVTAGETTATFKVADTGVTPIVVEVGAKTNAAAEGVKSKRLSDDAASAAVGLIVDGKLHQGDWTLVPATADGSIPQSVTTGVDPEQASRRSAGQVRSAIRADESPRFELTVHGTPMIRDRAADRAEASVVAAPSSDDKPLLVASVVDQASGEPLAEVSALAGTSPLQDAGWQWQPHTIHTFAEGEIQWPPPGRQGYDDQMIRIESPGYVPVHVRATAGKPMLDLEIRMVRDPGVIGQVVTEDGKPAAGAKIALGMTNHRTVNVADGTIVERPLPADAKARDRWSRPIVVDADAEGRFTLPTETAEHAVVVASHDDGFTAVNYSDFAKSPTLTLERWGKVEGQVLWGDKPGRGVPLSLGARTNLPEAMLLVSVDASAESDDAGRFTFTHVPPGPAQLSRESKPDKRGNRTTLLPIQWVEVKSGEPTATVFGGPGRMVIGKLAGRETWEGVQIRFALHAPHFGFPGDDQQWEAYSEFLNSPAGKAYQQSEVPVAADGTFQIENVPPEDYQLFVTEAVGDAKAENVGYASFTIESTPAEREMKPIDLGKIEVSPINK